MISTLETVSLIVERAPQGRDFAFGREDGGAKRSVFLHFANGRNVENRGSHPWFTKDMAARRPKQGDKVIAKILEGDRGWRAVFWGFESVRVKDSAPSTIRLSDIPRISKCGLQSGDLCVQNFDVGGSGYGPRVSWTEVIYRPCTGELFTIGCWDGESGGYFPDVPSGKLPDGVTIVEE